MSSPLNPDTAPASPLTLDIAICTCRDVGIRRLADANLPRLPGVRYVISWQKHGNTPVPASLMRDDISVFRLDTPGLSANRNNALQHCRGDIVLISDDDITYFPEALQEIKEIYNKYPAADLIMFRTLHGDMSRFPDRPIWLTTRYPKGYYVSSIEITMRRSRCAGLRFCTELGLGAPRLHGGEDEIFVYSAIKRGLKCLYYPLTICSHPHESTGTGRTLSDGNLMAQGCVLALMYPATCLLRILLKARRLSHAGKSSFLRALTHLTRGALAAPGLRRRHSNSLW